MKINLGCCDDLRVGFVNIDCGDYGQCEWDPPGQICDLAKGLPFEDSCADYILAQDIIEHLPDKILTMNEIWRVLKPGGSVDIQVPHTGGLGAFQDPTHVSFWNENSFIYYQDGHYNRERYQKTGAVKACFAAERMTKNATHLRVKLRAVKVATSATNPTRVLVLMSPPKDSATRERLLANLKKQTCQRLSLGWVGKMPEGEEFGGWKASEFPREAERFRLKGEAGAVEYFTWLSPDSVWTEECLERLLARMDSNPMLALSISGRARDNAAKESDGHLMWALEKMSEPDGVTELAFLARSACFSSTTLAASDGLGMLDTLVQRADKENLALDYNQQRLSKNISRSHERKVRVFQEWLDVLALLSRKTRACPDFNARLQSEIRLAREFRATVRASHRRAWYRMALRASWLWWCHDFFDYKAFRYLCRSLFTFLKV